LCVILCIRKCWVDSIAAFFDHKNICFTQCCDLTGASYKPQIFVLLQCGDLTGASNTSLSLFSLFLFIILKNNSKMYFKAAFDEKIPCESKFFHKKKNTGATKGEK